MRYSLFASQSSMGRRFCVAVFLVLVGLALSACGKKPGFVDAPVGASPTEFPRAYPDIATDKRP